MRKEYKTLPSGAVLTQCLSLVTSLHREEHRFAFIFFNEIFVLYWSGVIYDAALVSGDQQSDSVIRAHTSILFIP